MTRRRLLLLTDSLAGGSEARHLRAILGRLSRSRFDVRLASLFDGPPPPDDIERSRVESRHLGLAPDAGPEEIAEELGPVVEESAYDLIHAHSPVAAAAVARVAGDRPIVLSVHGLDGRDDHDGAGGRPDEDLLAAFREGKAPRRCIASTEAIRGRLEGSSGMRGVRVIPPFVELAGFVERYDAVDRGSARRQWGLQRGEVVVLHVGSLRRRDRILDLLEAFRVALRELPSLRLFVVGEGPGLSAARARAEELDTGDSVRFLADASDSPALLRMADIFTLPATHDDFPLPLLDAMTAGLPAVVAGEGQDLGAVEVGAALRVREGRAEHLARRMLELATDPRARADMGAAAVERASAFDVGRWIARLEGLYAEL